jgi:phosphate transport system substrate-binding protein
MNHNIRSSFILTLNGMAATLAVSLLLTGCGHSPSGGGGEAASKVTIQNKGSDTMVNLAQAWAEEYRKVVPDVSVEVSAT